MHKIFLLGLCLIVVLSGLTGQSQKIPAQADYWNINEESMKFDDHNGVPSLHISGDGLATIKDVDFQTGIIEFDYYATGRGFCGIYFRRQSGDNRTAGLNSEFFYLRSFKIDNLMVPGSVQYAPITRGTNLWDLLHDYESNALIKSESWNHVKLVISKEQMKCYLNNEMVLWIPELMGPKEGGSITLEGNGIYANMQIDKGNTEDVPKGKGADVTAHDVRYLKDWRYSSTLSLSKNTSPASDIYPDSTTIWTSISAGRAGLINLTDQIASPFIGNKREMVWLNTTLESSINQVKRLNLGFSDDVWVYINGNLLHVDKNTFARPIAKQPNGRLNIDNTVIDLPLQIGKNEITIAVANDFFGWGLVARLDNMNGITNKMTH